jgi:NAD(P)-dependent dehydrogenase (short-subunit alcohol dehydrogenase family)
MARRLAGKVALITGAARGQGRSHALCLAREGADVMLVDLCDNIPTCNYPLATIEDLDHTAWMIGKLGGRAMVYRCDVCDRTEMETAAEVAVQQLGGLDVVVANAGIAPSEPEGAVATFVDTFDVDFVGVVNTFTVAIPRLHDGASLIATGSASTTHAISHDCPSGAGRAAYALAQSMVEQYVQALAKQLAPHGVRVNSVRRSSGNPALLRTARMYRLIRRDSDRATESDVLQALSTISTLSASYAEYSEISAAVAFLAADDSRSITGSHMTVNGGMPLN